MTGNPSGIFRVFLSFNSKDMNLAELIRMGLSKFDASVQVFFSPVSLGTGFWLPKLAEAIAEADAFLLLIGRDGIGPWQEVEYFTAFDRHVRDKHFTLVPVLAAGSQAPGLWFLRTLNWVEAPVVEDRVLHRLLAALKGDMVPATRPLWRFVHPYRGLEAMTEANADYFYGRTFETEAVLTALAEKPGRMPILIGASGVGKSSVARAGVLSALKSMRWPGSGATGPDWPRALSNSRSWLWLNMRPGEAPLDALVAVFMKLWQLELKDPDDAALPGKWARGLATGNNTLANLVDATQDELKKQQGEAPERILLYVDQAEELYKGSVTNAQRFSELLANGLVDTRLLALASLRADYFDRLQADEPLFQFHEHINVPPLDRPHIYEVVTPPARALEVSFESDEIAARITDAAAAQPGALPLLLYLLTDMWSEMLRRGDACLRLTAQAIDVGSVLAHRAEAFLQQHADDEGTLRRLLTLRLAIVSAEGEPVRRQTNRDDCSEAEWSLALRLAEFPWRLVVISERESDNRIVAEVTHEAFLRAWPRLLHWLREERDFLVFKGEIERAERRSRDVEAPDEALLTGLDLTRAEEWFFKRRDDLPQPIRAFIERSIASDRAQKQMALRLQRRVSVGAGAAALVMALVGAFAWFQWQEAAQQRDKANGASYGANLAKSEAIAEKEKANDQLRKAQLTQSLFLADLANQRAEAGDFTTAMLLAIEALPDKESGIERAYVSQAEVALYNALEGNHERLVLPGQCLLSDDRRRCATTSEKMPIQIWNLESGKEVSKLPDHSGQARAISRDGGRVVTADGGITQIWDVKSATKLAVLRAKATHADFSQAADRIVTVSGEQDVRVWDSESGTELKLLRHPNEAEDVSFDSLGKRVVSASWDSAARVWDLETGKEVARFVGHEHGVTAAKFSKDGRRVVTASRDKTVRVWDFESQKEIMRLEGFGEKPPVADFDDDGTYVYAVSADDIAVKARVYPDTQTLIESAKKSVPRCLVATQRDQFFLEDESPDWCYELEKWPYRRRRFGISSTELTDDLRKKLHREIISGVLVTRVVKGLPADSAGLRVGDIILTVGGVPVDTASAFSATLDKVRFGENVQVTIVRASETLNLALEPRY